MKFNMKVRIDSQHRISQLNLANAYLKAAETISNNLQLDVKDDIEKWSKIIQIIPMLFLLRQSVELSIKSIFISYNKEFELNHDIIELANDAKVLLKLTDELNIKKWEEVEQVVKAFFETTYGGERLFIKNDVNSTLLRYLQTDKNSYKGLASINYLKLVKDVKRVRVLCEAFTLIIDVESYIYSS